MKRVIAVLLLGLVMMSGCAKMNIALSQDSSYIDGENPESTEDIERAFHPEMQSEPLDYLSYFNRFKELAEMDLITISDLHSLGETAGNTTMRSMIQEISTETEITLKILYNFSGKVILVELVGFSMEASTTRLMYSLLCESAFNAIGLQDAATTTFLEEIDFHSPGDIREMIMIADWKIIYSRMGRSSQFVIKHLY